MQRAMVSYRRDPEDNDAWVAVLDCWHGRHLRHEPPLRERSWVLDPAERTARLGTLVDCLKCDRLELPDDLVAYKHTPIFTELTLPAGLKKAHSTKAGVWARVEIIEGEVDYVASAPVSETFRLDPSCPGIVAPQHLHHLELLGPVRLRVAFLRPAHRDGPRDPHEVLSRA